MNKMPIAISSYNPPSQFKRLLIVLEDNKINSSTFQMGIKINLKKVDHNKNFQKTQFRVLKRKLNLFY